MRKRLLVIASLVLAMATVTFAADDPFVGTWKLNVAKSKGFSGHAPKSDIGKIEAQDNGIKWTGDGVDAEGKAGHTEFSAKFDGKDYPATGFPNIGTISVRKIDSNTLVTLDKMAGKVVGSWRFTVSKDRKTLTCATKGKDAKGQDFNLTMVYDKQ